MATIEVNTDTLRSCGTQIESLAQQFQTEYTAMIQAADNTRSGWTGTDNTAFLQKVDGLTDDYQRVQQVIAGIAQDLQESAQRYETTQSDVQTQAGSLADSF